MGASLALPPPPHPQPKPNSVGDTYVWVGQGLSLSSSSYLCSILNGTGEDLGIRVSRDQRGYMYISHRQ